MKRFKAIYLILILAFVWIGAAVAAYMLLLSPEITKTKEEGTKYDTALSEMNTSITAAQAAYGNYASDLQTFVTRNNRFHEIQETQPDIYSMTERFDKSRGLAMDGSPIDQKGLRLLYKWMAAKKYTSELRKWVKGYNVSFQNDFAYNFSAGPMGFEDTFTAVRLVEVDFGQQDMVAYGYPELLNKINDRTGYKYFPLLISGAVAAAAPPPGSEAGGMPASGGTTPGGMPASGGTTPGGMPASGGTTPVGPGGMPRIPPPPPTPQSSTSLNNNYRTANSSVNSVPSVMRGQAGAPPPTNPAPTGAAPPTDPNAAPPGTTPVDPGAAGGAAAGSGSFGTLTITVDRTNRRHTSRKPALKISYNAKGYFFTKGWDPNLDSPSDFQKVQADLAYAKLHRNSPEAPPASPVGEAGPTVLFLFEKIPAPAIPAIVK